VTVPAITPPALDPAVVADDARLAAALADGAGHALLGLRERFHGPDSRALKDAGDRLGHGFLTAALHAYRPDDLVLSEEGKDDPARLDADRVWIVDPLDGTREFSEPPRDDWAIHVALWVRGAGALGRPGELTAGAVALPGRGVTLSTYSVAQPTTPIPARPRVLVSRTRPPVEAQRVAEALGAELVPMGSAGAKAMAVLLGDGDVYVHSGGQYEWDSAAPVAVARAAGLFCSRIDGSALEYNQRDVSLPDLIVCRPELADAVLAAAANR
jgi:3'(2'), 5'-bisphosphate nucleotidase